MVDVATWTVTSFYRFIPLEAEALPDLRMDILTWMTERAIRGLLLLSTEGINATIAGSEEAIVAFKAELPNWVSVDDIRFKDSTCTSCPFKRLTVDIRKEIVTLKRTDLVPDTTQNHHLSPQEWHDMLNSEKPPICIDTRNHYETIVGKFKGAIDPDIKHFSDWGPYLDSLSLPKDEPVMIYCTGGIRCEKAILEMQERGFEQVYQLRDGILAYMAEFPDGLYEGECFVFDDRVALDRNLQPSQTFGICPGCGLTANTWKTCEICGERYVVCPDCLETWTPTCNKTCRDLWNHRQVKLKKQNA